jgi:hypothetical protein
VSRCSVPLETRRPGGRRPLRVVPGSSPAPYPTTKAESIYIHREKQAKRIRQAPAYRHATRKATLSNERNPGRKPGTTGQAVPSGLPGGTDCWQAGQVPYPTLLPRRKSSFWSLRR